MVRWLVGRWAALALALAACGPSVGPTISGSGGADGGTTGGGTLGDGEDAVTTAGPSAGPTGADVSGGADGSTGGGGSTGPVSTTTGATTGDVACSPPEGATSSFMVEPDQDVSANCVVAEILNGDASLLVQLDCGTPVSLTFNATPNPPVLFASTGDMIHLEYTTELVFWTNRWLGIFTTGGVQDTLLLGAVSSANLDPPGTTLDAFFSAWGMAPSVSDVGGGCDLMDVDCGPVQRKALQFGVIDGGQTIVYDGQMGIVDVLAFGYRYVVGEAIQSVGTVGCEDVPPAWYELSMVYFPSD